MSRQSLTDKTGRTLQGARRLSLRRSRRQRQLDSLRTQLTAPAPHQALSMAVAVVAAGAAAAVLNRRRRQAAAQQEPAPPTDSSVNGWAAPSTDFASLDPAGNAGPDPATPPAPEANAAAGDDPPNESAPGHEFTPAPEPGTTSAAGDPDAPNESAPGHHPDVTGKA